MKGRSMRNGSSGNDKFSENPDAKHSGIRGGTNNEGVHGIRKNNGQKGKGDDSTKK